jgi:hypothetical protein
MAVGGCAFVVYTYMLLSVGCKYHWFHDAGVRGGDIVRGVRALEGVSNTRLLMEEGAKVLELSDSRPQAQIPAHQPIATTKTRSEQDAKPKLAPVSAKAAAAATDSRRGGSAVHAEINNALGCNSPSIAAKFFCDQDYRPTAGHLQPIAIPYSVRQGLWQRARQFMSEDFIASTLKDLKVTTSTIAGNSVGIWAPSTDIGVTVALKEQARNEYGAKFDLDAGELFVDIGSNLGIVTIRAALGQPKGRFVAIEAASPTWLMQQMNLISNVPAATLSRVYSACAGLAGSEGTMTMAYRPWSTTSTRDWSPESERDHRTVLVSYNNSARLAYLSSVL